MSYNQKPNTGALFENSRKRPDSKDPDRSGSALIDGKEYWVSGWFQYTRSNQKMLSLTFKPKDESQAQAPAQAPSPNTYPPRSQPAPPPAQPQAAAPAPVEEDDGDAVPF